MKPCYDSMKTWLYWCVLYAILALVFFPRLGRVPVRAAPGTQTPKAVTK